MQRIEKVFPAISVTFIIFICSLVIALNHEYLSLLTRIILVVVVCLNVGGMLAGYGVGALFRLEEPKRRTLAIEIGMQNAGLGSTLALQHFGPRTAAPAAVFVFVCILTASIVARIWNHRRAAAKDAVTP